MDKDTNKNRSKWMIGIGVLVVLVIAGYAVFAGPMGGQLTGSLSNYKLSGSLKPSGAIPQLTTNQKLSVCNSALSQCNTCLDIIIHTSNRDLTAWMNTNGVTSAMRNQCTTRISQKTMDGIENAAFRRSEVGMLSNVCEQALNVMTFGGNWGSYLADTWVVKNGKQVHLTAKDCADIGYFLE